MLVSTAIFKVVASVSKGTASFAALLMTALHVTLMGSSLAAAAANPLASPELYGALPTIADAEISPNGEAVAMLQYVDGRTLLVVFDITDENSKPEGFSLGNVKPKTLYWAGDGHILILVSFTKNQSNFRTGREMIEYFRWVSFDVSERKSVSLFKNEPGFVVPSAGRLLATLPNESAKAVFARWSVSARGASGLARGPSLFEADLEKGRTRLLSAGNPETIDWVVDENGKPLARVDRDTEKLTIYSRQGDGSRLKAIRTYPVESGDPSPIILYGRASTAKKGSNEVVAGVLDEGGSRKLIRFDLSTGEELGAITSENGVQMTRASYDPSTSRADRGYVSTDSGTFFYFDPRIERIRRSLGKVVDANDFGIYSASADQNVFIVKTTHSDVPPDFMIYSDQEKTLEYFSSTRPNLVEDVIDRREFNYTAPDGLEIEGYLTTPQGKWGNPLPLIALPHGGPIGRDTLDYDWWAAFYAANGYAVYQPNFRGSTGYGKAFEEAGHGEWGAKMQDDITNGVNELIKAGHADGTRVCIVGASYGGYAALAGATLTPDLYTCAVSVNGVSDLPAFIGHAQRRRGDYGADYWEKRIGSRFKDAELLAAISPANIADRAGPPIQLIHGEDDTVVPIYQSERMAKALETSGKAFEFIKLEGEDHWLSSGETRTSMLRESLRFIEAHIGE